MTDFFVCLFNQVGGPYIGYNTGHMRKKKRRHYCLQQFNIYTYREAPADHIRLPW